MSWPLVKLGELCVISRGGSPRPIQNYITEDSDGLNWIKIGDVSVGDKYIVKTAEKIKRSGLSHTREIQAGDFLLSNSMSFGRPYISKISGCIHDGWLMLRDVDGNFSQDYLYHMLSSGAIKAQFQKFATGAVVKNLNKEVVAKVEVPLPPIAEQKRIAEILDKAASIKLKREGVIAKLNELAQSTFVEMFGDPVANTKKWPVIALGAATKKMGSGSTPTGGDSAYKAEGIALIRSLNDHDNEFVYKNLAFIDEEQARRLANVVVEKEDVLLNITGASVARVCRVPNDVLPARVNQHVMIIRPSEIFIPVFLEMLLVNRSMKNKLLQVGGAGATREAITKAQAEALEVICPPIDLQMKFATAISKIKQVELANKRGESKIHSAIASLQNQAFTTGFAV